MILIVIYVLLKEFYYALNQKHAGHVLHVDYVDVINEWVMGVRV